MQQTKIIPQTTLSARDRYYFHGYFFCCKGFSHKSMECRTYIQRLEYGNSRGISKNDGFTRVLNLFINTIKCFSYHKNGHKSNECPLKYCDPSPQKGYREKNCMKWKRKLNRCDLVLIAQDQNNQCYVESGCSKNMVGDRSNFISFDEKKFENLTFSNDKAGKIKGKGTVSLNNVRGEAHGVWFVDGLKSNVLSVCQICDKGC